MKLIPAEPITKLIEELEFDAVVLDRSAAEKDEAAAVMMRVVALRLSTLLQSAVHSQLPDAITRLRDEYLGKAAVEDDSWGRGSGDGFREFAKKLDALLLPSAGHQAAEQLAARLRGESAEKDILIENLQDALLKVEWVRRHDGKFFCVFCAGTPIEYGGDDHVEGCEWLRLVSAPAPDAEVVTSWFKCPDCESTMRLIDSQKAEWACRQNARHRRVFGMLGVSGA